MNRLRFLLSIPLLSNLATIASAADDPGDDEPYDTYLKYLRTQGLKAEECVDHSPSELFGIIREREKLSWRGTTGHGATVVDKFYAKYLETLQPYIDKHSPDVAKARPALRELYYFLTDTFEEDVGHHRTYIDHKRVDAYVEHLIAVLGEGAISSTAWDLDLSIDDAAGYVRTRLILLRDFGHGPNFDLFRGQLASKLRQIEKQFGFNMRELNYYVVCFADNYFTPLDPLRSAPVGGSP